MQFWKTAACLILAGSVLSTVSADEKKERKKGDRKQPTPTQRFVADLELTDAQKEQIAAIDKEFAEKFREVTKARMDILTSEQQKAERDAAKSAKSAGKKGPEARKAVEEALKLTDEQKTKLKDAEKAQQELNAKIVTALRKVLTPEQQEKLPKIDSREGKGKGKKKNGDAK